MSKAGDKVEWADDAPWPLHTAAPDHAGWAVEGTLAAFNGGHTITVRRAALQGYLAHKTSPDVAAKVFALRIAVSSVSRLHPAPAPSSLPDLRGVLQQGFAKHIHTSPCPLFPGAGGGGGGNELELWCDPNTLGALRAQHERDVALVQGDKVRVVLQGDSAWVREVVVVAAARDVDAKKADKQFAKGAVDVGGMADRIAAFNNNNSEGGQKEQQGEAEGDDDEWEV